MILELHSPLDMHLHLRDGDMLKLVAPLSSASFAGAVIMPNLVPPVADADAVQAYRQRVLDACGDDVFQPYMTAFFRSYSEKELSRLKELVFGIKLYPAGATTNSEGGVKAMKDAEATLSIMQEMDIPLLVHGESHGFVMDREAEFLDVYRDLATRFPRLTICMEHITTAAAVQLLDEFENLAATVTLQHLLITLDICSASRSPKGRKTGKPCCRLPFPGIPASCSAVTPPPIPSMPRKRADAPPAYLLPPSPFLVWRPCLTNTEPWTGCRALFPVMPALCTG